jgi:CBS domain-containing protein
MVLVKDVIDRELYFVAPSQSVAEVATKMVALNIGAICVLDEARLLGVFSERDLLTRVVMGRLDPDSTPVRAVMTRNVATVSEAVSIDMAMDSMRVHQCRHLPVLRGDAVVGFLSMRDLMHHELNRKTEELLRMRAYIHGVT